MDIKRFSADSAVPGVNRNVIQAQIVVVSDIETMQKFDNHIKSYIDLIDQNQKQIETLSTLRDTLLPKLLSGEIEVKV
jgi:type I restriction enzyme S subunit